MSHQAPSILLVGAGKMGGALLQGWLDTGLPPSRIAVLDLQPSDSLTALARERGFALGAAPIGLAPDILVLAIKPQMLTDAAPSLGAIGLGRTVLISILAGKTIAELAAHLPVAAVIRAMPNTPAAVRRGITGAFAGPGVTQAQRAMADTLLRSVGAVAWLDGEEQINAVTAVSGSGPAYVFLLVDCLAEAARAAGLPTPLAEQFARATVEGAGALLASEPTVPAEQLRRNVTSPGGTTAAALRVLMEDDVLRNLMVKAVAAARQRAVELAG